MFSWLGVVALLATFLCSSCQQLRPWTVRPSRQQPLTRDRWHITGKQRTAADQILFADMTDHIYMDKKHIRTAANQAVLRDEKMKVVENFIDRNLEEIYLVMNNNNDIFVSRRGWTKSRMRAISLEVTYAGEPDLYPGLSGALDANPPRQMVTIEHGTEWVQKWVSDERGRVWDWVNEVTLTITHCGPFSDQNLWIMYDLVVRSYRTHIQNLAPNFQQQLRAHVKAAYRIVRQIGPVTSGRGETRPALEHVIYNRQVKEINSLHGIVAYLAPYTVEEEYAEPDLQFRTFDQNSPGRRLNENDLGWPVTGSGIWDVQDFAKFDEITEWLNKITINAAAGA